MNLTLSRLNSLPDLTPQTPLGTAAWLPDSGLPLFQAGAMWLGRNRYPGNGIGIKDDRHVLVCGGSRSGKGTCFIIPNLCTWPGSVVVVDPKGENAIVTARRRGNGSVYCDGLQQKVHILDPFGVAKTPEDSFDDLRASYNPLDVLRADDPESVETSFRVADAMVTGERSSDPFWDDSAKDFISYVQLHVATAPEYPKEVRNLLTVRKLIAAGEVNPFDKLLKADGSRQTGHALLFERMKRNPAFGGIIQRAGESFSDLEANSPRLFGSIVQVAKTNTRWIEGQNMERVLGRSSFRISDLKTSKRGESVYLSLPQRAMESHFRWLRMMVTLITTEMERVRRQPASGYPVLMILDEFPALRRMRTIENAAAQIAGYGVKLVFVVQTLAQMKDEYKDNWETFVANSGLKIFSCSDDHFTREYVSKLIGDHEVVRRLETASQTIGVSQSQTHGSSLTVSSGTSFSTGGDRGSLSWNTGRSTTQSSSRTFGVNISETRGFSTSIHKRALVSPDEVGRLFGDLTDPKALVLISGQQPASLKRTFYFKEDWLGGTYGWHPDHPKPLTLQGWAEKRRRDKFLADQKAMYERWEREEKEAELARRRALAEQRAEEQRRERRNDWIEILQISAGSVAVAVTFWVVRTIYLAM